MPSTPTSVPRRSGEARRPAITAALARGTDLRHSRMRGKVAGATAGWQAKVMKYDLDGPSIVGYYLDTVALLASLCPLRVSQMQSDGSWALSEDPVLSTILRAYTGRLVTQRELVYSHVRCREGVGDSWIIDSNELGWTIVTLGNVQNVGGDGDIVWTDLYGIQRRTPAERTWRSWVQDPYRPDLAYSSLRRTLGDVARIHSAMRSMTRAANSRLASEGLLAFPDDAQMHQRPLSKDAVRTPDGMDELIESFMDVAQLAHDDDDSIAAAMPFAYRGPAATPVEIGRGLDEYIFQMEEKAIEGFARGVNFPAQLLVDGPGAANHWNEWVLQDVQMKMGLAPKLEPVCDDITRFFLLPALQRFMEWGGIGNWSVDLTKVRVEPDYSFLAAKPDMTANVMAAWAAGLIDRHAATAILGFTEELELPAGMDEFEFWQLANGKGQHPFVQVGADGTAVPIPDPSTGLPPGMAPPVDPMALADPNAVTDAEVVEEPPEAPAMIAAVSTAVVSDDIDIEALSGTLDELAQIDRDLFLGLSAAAGLAANAAATAVVRALIRAHPQRDPRRAELRQMSVDEAWHAASEEAKAQVDVDAEVQSALTEYREELEALFLDAAQSTVESLGDGGDDSVFPEAVIAAAVLALLLGLRRSVVRRFTDPEGFRKDGSERRAGVRSGRVPDGVIRDAMIVAGGAAVLATGALAVSAAGGVTPSGGGAWAGGTGMASGHAALERLPIPRGYRMRTKWLHGFWRKPVEPFKPHEDLDGEVFDALGDVPGGFYPGDHRNCTCYAAPWPERI